jgi:Ca-activated chloride channel family protein
MQFLWPNLLWLLLLLPALVLVYVYALRRRKKAAIRYSSLVLVRDAIRPGQKIRRHVPPAIFLLGLALAIFALARPTAEVVLPTEHSTLILAMDVSRSMQATDVSPDRLTAAQVAAKGFIAELPKHVRVGIVSFAATASVVQTPTENHDDLIAAIDRFQLQRGTATGSALILSLATLFPDAGIDLESVLYGRSPDPVEANNSVAGRARRERGEKKAFTPVAPGSYTAGAIVMLSDGRRTTGPDPLDAARMAADRGVRVHTVGLGTKEGAMVGFEGYSYYMMLDEETLKAVAKITGGDYYNATNANDLAKIYQNLSLEVGLAHARTEISALLSAGAVFLIVCAALLSMLWLHRAP